MEELVVLVDEHDNELGTTLKSQVHTDKTPLHRAFSIFLFDRDGRVLVTQRALTKKTWPGIWSNSCCGHPAPGEPYERAIERRVGEELGCRVQGIEKVSDYRYRFERDGVMENEICPVYRGVILGEVNSNPTEVHDWKWMKWNAFLDALRSDQDNVWSPWAKEEVGLFPA